MFSNKQEDEYFNLKDVRADLVQRRIVSSFFTYYTPVMTVATIADDTALILTLTLTLE